MISDLGSRQLQQCRMSSTTLILTGKNVLLPGNDTPQPATIKIDKESGKIIDVRVGYKVQETPDVNFINAGDKFILPGLVEWVQLRPLK
jgi:allantoinase